MTRKVSNNEGGTDVFVIRNDILSYVDCTYIAGCSTSVSAVICCYWKQKGKHFQVGWVGYMEFSNVFFPIMILSLVLTTDTAPLPTELMISRDTTLVRMVLKRQSAVAEFMKYKHMVFGLQYGCY
jgi:hypothetical protein